MYNRGNFLRSRDEKKFRSILDRLTAQLFSSLDPDTANFQGGSIRLFAQRPVLARPSMWQARKKKSDHTSGNEGFTIAFLCRY